MEHTGTWLEEYFYIVTDPAHALAEVTFTLLFDFFIVFLIWGIIVNKVIIPKLKRDLHREIDTEHGVPEHD